MSRLLYSGLLYLALPLLFIRLLWRSLRVPAYRRRWRERLAFYGPVQAPREGMPRVVFHAVSVGEVHAAHPLIERLLKDEPTCAVLVTTTTPSGSARVQSLFRDRVDHVYLPWDLPGAMKRFLHWWRPDLLVVLETELWPNLMYASVASQVRVMLVNARLSDKSRRGYARFPGLSAQLMSCFDTVCAQSSSDGERLLQLGLAPERLSITGSLKFDQSVDQIAVDDGRQMKQRLAANRPVLIAASTREGEEAIVLKAYAGMVAACPELLLILVPRHPERCDQIYRLCQETGYRILRRSEDDGSPGADNLQVLLGDSMGEMWRYYGAADIAFVGGSLVNTGCQNIIEPAALGLPVLTGPSLFNFRSAADQLIESGALQVVKDSTVLAQTVVELVANPDRVEAMSRAGRETVNANRGATERIYIELKRLLDSCN